jgi:hypothetical protein
MMNSIHNQVEKQIKRKRKGSVFFAEDFKAFGNPDAVKMALCRLVKEGIVVRVAQGIYLYPKIDSEMGRMAASTETIAKAIAKRDRARIMPTGIDAMNRLGFSTQVPMNIVYLTDGSPRKVRVGRSAIKFKRSSPKNFALGGQYSSLVVLGLRAMGAREVTPEIKMLVANALSHEDPKALAKDILLAPARVAKIMREAMNLIQK